MPRGGAFAHPAGLTCGALDSFLELGDGELTTKNRKIQMPGDCEDVEVTN